MRLKARVFFQQPTMGRNAYRLIVFLLAAGTVGVAPFLYISWKNMRAENMERVLYEQKLEYQAQSLEKDRDYKREYYYRLLHDEKFAQRVIREKLGFADPRDIVFRFEDSVPTTIDDGIMPHFAPPIPKKALPAAAAETPAASAQKVPMENPQSESILRRLMRRNTGGSASPEFTIDLGVDEGAANSAPENTSAEPIPVAEPVRDETSTQNGGGAEVRFDYGGDPAPEAAEPAGQPAGGNVIRFRSN